MCFLPVRGKKGSYRHVPKAFVHSIAVDKAKLGKVAELLGIPARQRSKLKAGMIHLVNEGKPSKAKAKR